MSGHLWEWNLFSVGKCSRCGVGREKMEWVCIPKPATPEPPEWKGVPGAQMVAKLGTVPKGAVLRGIGPDGPIYDIPGTVTNTGVIQTEAPEWLACPDCFRPVDVGAWCRCEGGRIRQWKSEEQHRRLRNRPATPLDRALSDFIAKRKAKRKATAIEMRDHEDAKFMARNIEELDRAQILAEAMTLPISFTARMGLKEPG